MNTYIEIRRAPRASTEKPWHHVGLRVDAEWVGFFVFFFFVNLKPLQK